MIILYKNHYKLKFDSLFISKFFKAYLHPFQSIFEKHMQSDTVNIYSQ